MSQQTLGVSQENHDPSVRVTEHLCLRSREVGESYRLTEASWSFKQSTMVPLWRCTALWSVPTIFCSEVMAIYLDTHPDKIKDVRF